MKILVATDAHIYRTPDGKHWTPAIYGYSFWKRYLNVFDSVRIVARMKDVDKIEGKALLVDGPDVEVYPLPFYQGPFQLLKVYFKIKDKIKSAADGCDAAILRMPSQTAQMVFEVIKKRIPTAGEVVYDPYDDLKNKENPLYIRILDHITSRNLKLFCKTANGVSYVTESTIQKHYPSGARLYGSDKYHFESYYSTITLNDDAFIKPASFETGAGITISISDVSMNSDRKGEPVLFQAIQKARKKGYDVKCIVIGDGSKRIEFENLARSLGIADSVKFTGRLASADEVRNVLKDSNMYVFPTQAEGLPRGILEAMAIGLPVLSTPVGGIPEVIDNEYLFSPSDVDGFSEKICWLYDHPEELNAMALKNYNKSLEFMNCKLQAKRDDFYKKLLIIAQEIKR